MTTSRQQAEIWLKQALGTDATFREGQWEAINALVVNRQRVLVVQRTGWGKSLVYFMATRLLRQQGAGVTILISPLLSLMRNQIDSARQWGLHAASINSSNYDAHADIEASLLNNEIDLLLISPERLANDRFRSEIWSRLRHQVGMLVVDEAHCISDWGHDFRPNYRRIMRILDELPSQTPIIGTTATANDRVVSDVAEILGAGINIQRGALTRESLSLYVYPEPMDHATRLTLLSHLLKSISGSGIIYCTTTRDCRLVAEWLQDEGHNVKPYFAKVEEAGYEDRPTLENQLMSNEVKALVSSVALGMGFDKSDLHFVIHYQLPSNIIGYYQQIGRAGRGIDKAYIILMHGAGDEDILRYFIDSAFPTPKQVSGVLDALRHQAKTRNDLQRDVNVRSSTLEKILTHLEVEGILSKEGSSYQLINHQAQPDYDRWRDVTDVRYDELRHMQAYTREDGCLMEFIARALDDPHPKRCGRCKNCTGVASNFNPDASSIIRAQTFLREGKPLTFKPRKRWIKGLPNIKKTTDMLINHEGLALCMLYDSGYGNQVRVARDKNTLFSDELVEASAKALQDYWQAISQTPDVIVPVPSLRRPHLVPDFAERLAQILNLSVVTALTHLEQHRPQAEVFNSYQQADNLLGNFAVTQLIRGQSILLVDDLTDSGWTLTLLGDLLQRQGASSVYPFAIATTSTYD
ncbi:MAG: RecQ family ATP-dependent DNA helicase [Chloroflexota bacterium]